MSNDVRKNNQINNIEKYRFGMGIEFVDNNIISGPDIERVVNNETSDLESSEINDEKMNS
jgi:hypothetical protein